MSNATVLPAPPARDAQSGAAEVLADRKARTRARARAILRTAAMVMRGVHEMQNRVEACKAEIRKLADVKPQDASGRKHFAQQRQTLLRELVQTKRRHIKASAAISPRKTRRGGEGKVKPEAEAETVADAEAQTQAPADSEAQAEAAAQVKTKTKARVTFEDDACGESAIQQQLHHQEVGTVNSTVRVPERFAPEAPNPSTVVVEAVMAALRRACKEQAGTASERRVEAELRGGAASLSALLATGELAEDCAALEEQAALHVVCQGVLRGIMACVLDVVSCRPARGASDPSWAPNMRALDASLAQLQDAEKRQLPRKEVTARSVSCIAVALPLWGRTTWMPTWLAQPTRLSTPPGSPQARGTTERAQARKKKRKVKRKRKAKAGASLRGANADVTSIRLHSAQTESSAAKLVPRKTPSQLSLLPNKQQSRSRARALLSHRRLERPHGEKVNPLNWYMAGKE